VSRSDVEMMWRTEEQRAMMMMRMHGHKANSSDQWNWISFRLDANTKLRREHVAEPCRPAPLPRSISEFSFLNPVLSCSANPSATSQR
jgi:hypothetical protein